MLNITQFDLCHGVSLITGLMTDHSTGRWVGLNESVSLLNMHFVFARTQGDYAAARMYYQRALLLSPGSKLLKENLAKLDRLERRLTEGA